MSAILQSEAHTHHLGAAEGASSFADVAEARLHGGHVVFGDVGAHSLIGEDHLGVLLRRQWLQQSNHPTVLTRTSRLLLVEVIEPRR